MMISYKIIGFIALLLVSNNASAEEFASSAAATPVTNRATELASPHQDIRAQLSPHNYTTIAAEIGAKIDKLPFQEGASFKKGAVLVSFDCILQKTGLEKAKAVLSGAEKTFSANQRLAQLRSVGAIELAVSKTEVAKSRADVNSTVALINKCTITAPYDGRIAEQHVREQQYVQPGQPIIKIIDDSILELEFIVPSLWLSWIKTGLPFEVAIDETAKTYPAKIRRIGAQVDPVSQSIKLVATIDGTFPELISGMSGRIILKQPH
jgi:membrane fusion protein, multidrug efflux system